MLEIDPSLLEQRHRLGLDRWDEMWEGVLHMSPAPAREHQRILGRLLAFLIPLLERTNRGTVWPGINVFGDSAPADDYRIPDLTFVARGREAVLADDGVRGGGPDAVIEIRSPYDESYEKLPFMAKLGVRELVMIDRDTKRVEVLQLTEQAYAPRAPEADGSLLSESLGVRFATAGTPPRLLLIDTTDPTQRTEI
jgi:Uma2 family endonuclease